MTTYLNAYSTITTSTDGAPLDPSSSRSTDVAAELEHLAQFDQFIWNQAAGQPAVSSNVLALSNHIRYTRWHYVFEVAENFGPANLPAFTDWAEKANAVFVMPDLSVYNAAGQPLPTAAKPPRPPRAIRRMARIRGDLWNQGIRIPENLPAALSDDEIIARRPQSILPRAQALTTLAQATIDVAHGRPISAESADFSPAEQNFLAAAWEGPTPQLQQAARSGGVFALAAAETLAWALGRVEQTEVAFPQVETLRTALAEPADSLRPLSEIADHLELASCLRWWDIEHPQDPDRSGLIMGRVYALLWLVDPLTDWDDIQVNI